MFGGGHQSLLRFALRGHNWPLAYIRLTGGCQVQGILPPRLERLTRSQRAAKHRDRLEREQLQIWIGDVFHRLRDEIAANAVRRDRRSRNPVRVLIEKTKRL